MEWNMIPRLLISAPSSGSGKTVITCGLMQLLCQKGRRVAGFKCGPDYIDPLFHREVLGVESKNLDGFFQTKEQMEACFLDGCKDGDFAIIEGAMGYFDGIGGITCHASSYETAVWLNCPAILVVDGKGAGLSLAAKIQGFLEFQPEPSVKLSEEVMQDKTKAGFNGNNRIRGILLNRISKGMYPILKKMLEERFFVPVVGYVPELKWLSIESRHLGLKLPQEVKQLQEQIRRLAAEMEQTIDIETLAQIATSEPYRKTTTSCSLLLPEPELAAKKQDPKKVVIGVAKDEAFCFYYQDNLKLLERMGAKLEFFSPIWDPAIPKNASGLLFGGGYPELYGGKLEENAKMRASIRQAFLKGMPILGECGGFLYLQEFLEDENGICHAMVGAISGTGRKKGKSARFGYITVSGQEDGYYLKKGENILAHEFHYWDSDCCGRMAQARKPAGNRNWYCMRQEKNLLAGFPHLYYHSFPRFAWRFVTQCALFHAKRTPPSFTEKPE